MNRSLFVFSLLVAVFLGYLFWKDQRGGSHAKTGDRTLHGRQLAETGTGPRMLIRGATLYPVSGEPFVGSLLIGEGRIQEISETSLSGENAKEIDASGLHVYPGLIAANTCLGLAEISAVRASLDIHDVGDINPNLRAEVSVNPDSVHIAVTRSGGVLTALSVPHGGLLAGSSALLRLDGWSWEDMVLRAPVAIHVNWPGIQHEEGDERCLCGGPETAGARVRDDDHEPTEVNEGFNQLCLTLHSARAYLKGKRSHHSVDRRYEALIPVLQKKIPLFIHANRSFDIRDAVLWAAQEDLRVVIVGGNQADDCLDVLKRHDVAVILDNIFSRPSNPDDGFDHIYTLPQRLEAAGISFAIAQPGNSFAIMLQRNLAHAAAQAVGFGLDPATALRAITLAPARILGLGDQLGSLEVGKRATLFLADGDILDIRTRVEAAFIDGKAVDLDDKQKALYRRYGEKYRAADFENR